MKQEVYSRPGYDALWGWFGLSYASFLTIPRVLMHEMPDEWQGKMAKLLEEYDETFTNLPAIDTIVCLKKDGKFIKTPQWMINYRHPEKTVIEELK